MTTINLPPDLRDYVGAFSARRRRLALLRAVAIAATLAIGILLASCLLDRVAALSSGARVALLGANVVAVVLVLWRPARRWLRRDVDFLDESRAIEHQDPRFGQRLQTVTSQLLDRASVRGSEAFLSELTRDVAQSTRPGDTARLVPAGLVTRPSLVALACALLVFALTTISWLDLPRLLARYTAPLADIAPVTTTRLTLLGQAARDASVVQGSALNIGVLTKALPERSTPVFEITSDNGETFSRVSMTSAQTPGQFEFNLPAVDRSFAFRVTGGDTSTRVVRVAVLPRPVVTEFRVRYTYPPYMNRAPLNVTNTDGLIEAPVGSEAQVAVVSSQPLKSAELLVGKTPTPLVPTIEPTVFQARLKLQKESAYTVKLASTDGIDGQGPAGSVIRVLPDRPPLVQVIRPETDLRLGPRDLLAAQYRALDDFGVTSLSLRVQVNATEPRLSPIKLSRDSRLNEGSFTIDLAGFGLKVGDVVTYAFVAEDALKQQSTSDARRVLVSPRSIEMNTYQRLAELRGADELAKQLVVELSQADDAMRQARQRKRELAIREQGLISKAYQHLAGAGEAASALQQALLRAMTVTPSPSVSTAVASWLDDTQLVADIVERVDDQDFDSRDDLPRHGLTMPLERAKQVSADITLLTRAQNALTLQAEHDNLRHVPQNDAGELARLQLDRAKQDLNDGVRQLGLDPNAGDLDAKLAEIVHAGDEMTKARKAVSWAAASKKWGEELGNLKLPAPLKLDARLNVAAQAEAIRPDGDLVWARDQQLASRAAARAQAAREAGETPDEAGAKLIAEVSDKFSDALQIVRRAHRLREKGEPGDDASLKAGPAKVLTDAELARVLLRRWAGQEKEIANADARAMTAEQLAMEANAATAQKQYDKADALDKAREAAQADNAKADAENKPSPVDPAKNNLAKQDANANAQKADATKQTADANKQKADVGARNSDVVKAPPTPPGKPTSTEVARKLDELKKQQDALSAQTAGAKKDQTGDLAKQQKQLTQAISQAQEMTKRDEPIMTETPADDTRRAASEAIAAVQEKLAAMPEQLDKAQRASGESADARAKADAAARDAENAGKQSIEAEQRAAEAAKKAIDEKAQADAARREANASTKARENADTNAASKKAAAEQAQAKAAAEQAEAQAARARADDAKKKADATSQPAADDPTVAEAKRQAERATAEQQQAEQAKTQADVAGKAKADAEAQASSAKSDAEQKAAQADQVSKSASSAQDAAAKAGEAAKGAREQAGAAQTAAARAKAQADETAARGQPALDPVHPDVAEDLSRKLSEFAPETSAAADVIDQALTPALRELRRATSSNDKAGVAKATQSARQAIEAAQTALRDAQDQLVDQDPLAAAEWFADQAAEALKSDPPDLQKATAKQQSASAALQKAWNSTVQQTARQRLAGTARMTSVFQPGQTPTGEIVPVEAAAVGTQVRREWGQLRQRTPEELSAGSRQNDPPGYEESLKAYFEALGKGGGK